MDFGSKAFTGMYLLLESLTFVDVAVDVPGLGIWGSQEQVRGLVLDGQRFWFLGLVCGTVCGVVRLSRGEGKEGEKREKGERGVAKKSQGEGEKRGKILRRLVADVMDLAVPGSVVGWVPLSPETVGLLMLGSTVLTGMEVWYVKFAFFFPFIGVTCSRDIRSAPELLPRLPMSHSGKKITDIVGQGEVRKGGSCCKGGCKGGKVMASKS
jgi:hypothetical protein